MIKKIDINQPLLTSPKFENAVFKFPSVVDFAKPAKYKLQATKIQLHVGMQHSQNVSLYALYMYKLLSSSVQTTITWKQETK